MSHKKYSQKILYSIQVGIKSDSHLWSAEFLNAMKGLKKKIEENRTSIFYSLNADYNYISIPKEIEKIINFLVGKLTYLEDMPDHIREFILSGLSLEYHYKNNIRLLHLRNELKHQVKTNLNILPDEIQFEFYAISNLIEDLSSIYNSYTNKNLTKFCKICYRRENSYGYCEIHLGMKQKKQKEVKEFYKEIGVEKRMIMYKSLVQALTSKESNISQFHKEGYVERKIIKDDFIEDKENTDTFKQLSDSINFNETHPYIYNRLISLSENSSIDILSSSASDLRKHLFSKEYLNNPREAKVPIEFLMVVLDIENTIIKNEGKNTNQLKKQKQEEEVKELIEKGKSTREISKLLGISTGTVINRKKKIGL